MPRERGKLFVSFLVAILTVRYDILLKTKEDVSRLTEAFKMRFVAFTDISKKSTALCSIAWLKYPDQTVDTDYLHHHGCQVET